MPAERQSDGNPGSGAENEEGSDPRGSDDAFARGGAGDATTRVREGGGEATGQADGAPDGGPAAGADVQSADPGPPGALGEQRDRYLRLAAEYDNYRKRATRERQEAGARAQADLVKQLVDALDDLSRFAHVDPASTDVATITHGADLVERKLLKVLGSAGLEVINPLDQTFDPRLHEAVATERALSPEDDHLVARVYQPGYLFGGQLLRPARVVVKQWNA